MDINFDGIFSKLEVPLLARSREIGEVLSEEEIDKPITSYVEVEDFVIDHSKEVSANEVESWIGEINPNFDPFDVYSPFATNCGSCALAVFERLNGDHSACATERNIPSDFEMEMLTNKTFVFMSPEEIEQKLLNAGDGAHAIIGINRNYGPGHWFNAACLDGKVVAIDGQSGEILDWPPDYGDVSSWEMGV